MELTYLDAVILGIVEGITEYLPISSTGHLTATEKILGLQVDNPSVTGYTATIQIGAIAATLVFFWSKIFRLAKAFFAGLFHAEARASHDWTLGLAVIFGSLPVGIIGYFARHLISGPLRSLTVVAMGLILWSLVMWLAEEKYARSVREGKERAEDDVTIMDGVIIGCMQCFSLIPGVSRSGATISAGLFRNVNRVIATELSFFMAIPALTAAGLYGLVDVDFKVVPIGPMVVGIIVSFVVAYASIAWLLKFVANNSLMAFIYYRIPAGVILAAAVGFGFISPT
ncbi:Undecaprenyl-diphosphatase [Austwickia sp. TVS 96-490-7B]|uniref:undecaprenyl-diphosphate phosphatase n=1 Tax=Austwickia sp. TVS 96-490-7B TaxID=2830843 RepID=UPI001C57937D|nr:undecaprenyl-diphosphate phosphatase [Austwickia sp. TVS 96-490-7B]MBW3086251.1 Undecaprenyl-diphosphatase [Austwickia sp. TVS 96-490-7B]